MQIGRLKIFLYFYGAQKHKLHEISHHLIICAIDILILFPFVEGV